MTPYCTKHSWLQLHKFAPVKIRAVVIMDDKDAPMTKKVEIHINKGDAEAMIKFGYDKFPIGIKVIYVEH